MVLYLFIYVFATLGTFAVLTHLGSRDKELNQVEELAGLGRSRPVTAAILAICMFSLSGIPPLAGFWGKLVLFGGAVRLAFDAPPDSSVRIWFIVLSIVGVLNAAVAAAYYLRIVAVMYFRPQETAPAAQGGFGAWSAAAVGAAITVTVGLLPGTLIENSRRAEYAARGESEAARETFSLHE
jgi:NADH-quinone oxidoreductase subunit N